KKLDGCQPESAIGIAQDMSGHSHKAKSDRSITSCLFLSFGFASPSRMPFSFTWECQGKLTSRFASRSKRHLDTGHGWPVPLKTYQSHHILLKRFLRRALAHIYPKTRDLRTGDLGQTKMSRPAFVSLTVT